jgi:hypothetical protein
VLSAAFFAWRNAWKKTNISMGRINEAFALIGVNAAQLQLLVDDLCSQWTTIENFNIAEGLHREKRKNLEARFKK